MLESKRWMKSYPERAMQNPLFRESALNYGAWMLLIGMAAWQEKRFDIKGKTVTLQRGQLCASERHLGKMFGTSDSWARRFLARLKAEGMVEVHSEAGKNIVTICKYSLYQGQSVVGEAENEASQRVKQERSRNAAKIEAEREAEENSANPFDKREISGLYGEGEAEVEAEREAVISKKRSTNIEGRYIIPTVENNNKPTITDFSDFSADQNQARTYAFAGAVIRLNEADLEKWKSIYHAIPDLIAELHQLDDYYAQQPAAEVKNWFHRAKAALNKKHQDRLQARKDGGIGTTGPTGGGLGETDYAAMRRRQAERDAAEDAEIQRNLAQGGGETMEFLLAERVPA